ncbi:hypothetical protein FOMPIDRAFT_1131305 [Fomitopsis schrenkii]|uniref:Tyr recombinase domain-containing protein n=1 Tax=Fomitopsis schrenkii TaxID=2126942 RepID=S8DY08_FOMSC|nr:hypothetical protein FOMPIDRAFT_1131305 [Fomitopsis schrenkii]
MLVFPDVNAFQPGLHVARNHVRKDADRDGRSVWVITIPRTKTSSTGEDLSFATQVDVVDPVTALMNHLTVNDPPRNGPLFTYSVRDNPRPLTKHAFCKRVSRAAAEAKVNALKGHSLRIGGTLEYLLRGVPFEVVKTMGRWKSDAFQTYLRKHAQILAPYLQANPSVHEAFTRYSMPPVR